MPGVEYALAGALGVRLAANEAGWLLSAPDANLGLLQLFRDRDRRPVRDLLPWAGEFAGKYLTSGVLCLRLTGSSIVADELELSTFNAVLGAQSPSGRWWTYNTPMDGVRLASAHDIVFQARAGMRGTPYLSWLPFTGLEPVAFTRHYPLRQVRL